MTKRNYFSEKFEKKSSDELKNIVGNNDYQLDAQQAAAWELERRKEMDVSESKVEVVEEPEEEYDEPSEENYFETNDPNAPLLYHPMYVYVYGILFSVFFGGILMAVNLMALNKKKLAWVAIFTSLGYTTIQVWIVGQLGGYLSLLAFPAVFIGMFLMNKVFWVNQVEAGLAFRKRPIWFSLSLAILIWAVMIAYSFTELATPH